MTNKSNIIFKLLSILIILVEIGTIAAIGLLIKGGVLVTLHPDQNTINYSMSLGHHSLLNSHVSPLILISTYFLALFISASYYFIIDSPRRLVNNLRQGAYFVQANLMQIKKVMIAVLCMMIFQFMTSINYCLVQLNATQEFDLPLSEIFTNILILVAIYVIYLIFNKGMALQEDSDSMI
ncbi:DUF2975 domain-containing protein [Convivina intestini]|uniref:DUF2975 family protein n=1 Tax=Convivina intestini TaxID=1505726 RepID=A0A2U1D637_9LACO|nr:DUF2975 domain-containing protein [Convivina intestini]PVY83146.1 hypothetical protein C7384_10822 [Convivina intestini]CAH1856319.1 hypothetical protein R077811_01232 [Convivina intestini]SDB95394.1 Protein of unknown function [Leuconostocaceae bacterium R-53105]